MQAGRSMQAILLIDDKIVAHGCVNANLRYQSFGSYKHDGNKIPHDCCDAECRQYNTNDRPL